VTTVNESISVGAKVESRQTPLTDPAQIELALRRLDGKTRSELVLEGRDDTVMIIGGGDKQQFVVSIAVNVDEQFFELLRSQAVVAPPVELVTGGQAGRFDAEQVVDLATATQAAVAFARDGKPDPALRWRQG
jgi:Immunity protein Imm1